MKRLKIAVPEHALYPTTSMHSITGGGTEGAGSTSGGPYRIQQGNRNSWPGQPGLLRKHLTQEKLDYINQGRRPYRIDKNTTIKTCSQGAYSPYFLSQKKKKEQQKH